MRNALALAVIFCAAVNEARAVQCQTGRTSGDSYWAWRLIDGRKCWYKGAPGMAKSLLHWPVGDAAFGPLMVGQTQALPEAQEIPPELPELPPQPTFEERWGLR